MSAPLLLFFFQGLFLTTVFNIAIIGPLIEKFSVERFDLIARGNEIIKNSKIELPPRALSLGVRSIPFCIPQITIQFPAKKPKEQRADP